MFFYNLYKFLSSIRISFNVTKKFLILLMLLRQDEVHLNLVLKNIYFISVGNDLVVILNLLTIKEKIC